jgi:hypothetical protein
VKLLAVIIVVAVLLLVLLRIAVCVWVLRHERKQLLLLTPGTGPSLSVVIPLFGWDVRFLDLLGGLVSAARRYGSPVETLILMNHDHPRFQEVKSCINALSSTGAHIRVLEPSAEVAPGGNDRMRRLRTGVRAATHGHVVLMDSDVLVDDDFFLRICAAHIADPTLRLAFALPSFRFASAPGDKTLAAFTLYHNLYLYFLGWFFTGQRTSIGPTQVVRNDDGALAPMLDELRDSIIDDHGLGHAVGKRGERVRALPFGVTVHASDSSVAAAARQVLRWMVASRHIIPLLTPVSAVWIVGSFVLSSAGVWLLGAAAWVLVRHDISDAAMLVVGASVIMILDGVGFGVLEATLWQQRLRLDACWRVPLATLVTPVLFVRSLASQAMRWRRL